MTTGSKSPAPAGAELAPEELDQVVGGGTIDKAGSPTLSQMEERRKLTGDAAGLSRQEEGAKKSQA